MSVTLDYLFGKSDMELSKEITEKILTIQRLPENEKEHIVFTLYAPIHDAKTRLPHETQFDLNLLISTINKSIS